MASTQIVFVEAFITPYWRSKKIQYYVSLVTPSFPIASIVSLI